jgi:hypothetical protein
MREKLTLTLCVLVATAACAVAETHPFALTARPVNDVAVGPKDPVPFQCDPCYYCNECLFSESSTTSWNGDMAYDELRNCMWTVEVCNALHGDGLEGWDYAGAGCHIIIECEGMSGICERGVAYDHNEDRLYESGWGSGIVTKVAPGSPCQYMGYCDLVSLGYPYYSVSGLAYDGNHNVIWVLTNSSPDWLYAIEPFPDEWSGTCTMAAGFYDGPMNWGCYSGTYVGGGLAYDITTNELYAQNQANQWAGTYTEVFDVGGGTNPTFKWGCLNTDASGNPFFGWGLGKKDGADEWWVTSINQTIVPPQTIYCQYSTPPECILEVIGYQNEVPPDVGATLDLLVQVSNITCEPITADMVFEFYKGKGCMGYPIRTLTAKNMTAACGDNCYVFVWGPIPNRPVCDWYSVKVTFDAFDPPCEDCWDFHIADPTPLSDRTVRDYRILDFGM